MNPWLVLIALTVLAVVFVVAPVAAASLSYWRRPWLVRCPREDTQARIAVNARGAALAEVLGRSGPEIVRCTLWRTQSLMEPCGQECLDRPVSERRPAGDCNDGSKKATSCIEMVLAPRAGLPASIRTNAPARARQSTPWCS